MMKKEQVIDLAEKSGATQWCPGWHLSTEELSRFAYLVEQATLELAASFVEPTGGFAVAEAIRNIAKESQ